MKRLVIALLAILLVSPGAIAATKSPTPQPKSSIKPTTNPTTKAAPKPTAKATSKATLTASSKLSAKPSATPTKKVTTTKKPIAKKSVKPKPKRSKKLPPEKPAVWPPKGYRQSADIYARIPTTAEVYYAAGKDKSGKLSSQLDVCNKVICGAVFVGSSIGCDWWEISSEVYGPASETDKSIIKYGDLRSLFKGSAAKVVMQFILVSEVPYNPYFNISGIKLTCNRSAAPTDLNIPSNTYTPLATNG